MADVGIRNLAAYMKKWLSTAMGECQDENGLFHKKEQNVTQKPGRQPGGMCYRTSGKPGVLFLCGGRGKRGAFACLRRGRQLKA